MAGYLNIIYLFPALALLAEFVRLRVDIPLDEQTERVAYEDRVLVGAVFGAVLPALLNGSALVLLGVLVILAAQGYMMMQTDRDGMVLLPTAHFRSRNIDVHQNLVLGLAGAGLLIGFVVSLIFGAMISAILGLVI